MRGMVKYGISGLGYAALAVIMLSGLCLGEDLRLRCRWLSPNDRSTLDVTFDNNACVVVLPGEKLDVYANHPSQTTTVTLVKNGNPYREDLSINFTAPTNPGSYYMVFTLAAGAERRDVELYVFVPYKATGRRAEKGIDLYVDGTNMGNYRDVKHSGNVKVREHPESYQPPVWWIRITPDNEMFELIPGVKVGDLVAFTEDTGLRHTDIVPVCYPMWEGVEALRAAISAKGIPGSALKLISVFRSPLYNRQVGSNAFGRHIYGDAFDFYIDLEGDTKASDLNGDRKVDRKDAYRIVSIIENLQADRKIPMGGIGVYQTVGGDHGLTMHLDMRGHRATWGFYYSAGGRKSEFSWATRRFPELQRADEDAAAERARKAGNTYRPPNREPLPVE